MEDMIYAVVREFLSTYDPDAENYFTQDPDDDGTPDDWSGGQTDDAMYHGYEAGQNEAQGCLVKMLDDAGIKWREE